MTDKSVIVYSSVLPLARRAMIGIYFPPIGGTFFGTLCPSQDETMSHGSLRPKALGSWTRMGPLWEAFHKIVRLCRHALGRFCLVAVMHTGRAVKSNQVTMQCLHTGSKSPTPTCSQIPWFA